MLCGNKNKSSGRGLFLGLLLSCSALKKCIVKVVQLGRLT